MLVGLRKDGGSGKMVVEREGGRGREGEGSRERVEDKGVFMYKHHIKFEFSNMCMHSHNRIHTPHRHVHISHTNNTHAPRTHTLLTVTGRPWEVGTVGHTGGWGVQPGNHCLLNLLVPSEVNTTGKINAHLIGICKQRTDA